MVISPYVESYCAGWVSRHRKESDLLDKAISVVVYIAHKSNLYGRCFNFTVVCETLSCMMSFVGFVWSLLCLDLECVYVM